MNEPQREEQPERPEELLDAIESGRDWSEANRRAYFDRWVGKFSGESWRLCLRTRLNPLNSLAGEAVLRMVEVHGDDDLFDALVEAIRAQENLPPELLWEALDVLESAGKLAGHADLEELRDELEDRLETEEEVVNELIDTLEADEDGPKLVAKALETIEPDVRADLLADLAKRPSIGPGVRTLFDLLARSDVRSIRAVVDRIAETDSLQGDSKSLAPIRLGSLVTAIDGNGRGLIALAMSDHRGRFAAAFLCDVIDGILGATEDLGDDPLAFLAELAERPERESLLNHDPLAFGLLAGCLGLNDPTPHVRKTIERLAGPDFQGKPFLAPGFDEGGDGLIVDDDYVRELLDGCPNWIDDSPLVDRLAKEIFLRERSTIPDPERDAGAYRFFFEHRLADRLERFARMFVWTAAFWRAGGADAGQVRNALTLANRLIDPQHAVPGHPFAVEWTTRALSRALRGFEKRSAD